MLAQKAEGPFDSEQHLFEIKWDGIRCLAFVEGGRVRLQSRQLVEITVQFPELASLSRLPSGTILDGELVALQDGKPSFRHIQQRALLQNRQRIQDSCRCIPATYMVFDLLYLKGKPLMASSLSLRRDALQTLVEQIALPEMLVPRGIVRHGCQMFDRVASLGLEGIVAKRVDGPYLPGKRSRHWLKIKPKSNQRSLP
jgi:ATP-dependent DNA ligase